MNNGETSERNADRKRRIIFLPSNTIPRGSKNEIPWSDQKTYQPALFFPSHFASFMLREKERKKRRGGTRRVTGQFTQLNNALGLNFHSAANNSLFCSSRAPFWKIKQTTRSLSRLAGWFKARLTKSILNSGEANSRRTRPSSSSTWCI